MFAHLRRKGYLVFASYLPPGSYKTNAHLSWHQKLRVKLAKWLYLSVKPDSDLTITITTGVSGHGI